MKLIVLTGGIACGKTTVATILKDKYHIPIVDSDEITHKVQEPGGSAYAPIVKYFGESILNEDKTINRKALGDIIFQDKEKRHVLNKIVHPEVFKSLGFQTAMYYFSREPFVILDIPLFFEIKMPKFLFNDIITVAANPEIQLERLMKRNSFTEEEARHRIGSQMPIADKCKQSTIVIQNDSDREDLEKQVDKVVENWKKSSMFTTIYQDPIVLLLIFVLMIAAVFRMLVLIKKF